MTYLNFEHYCVLAAAACAVVAAARCDFRDFRIPNECSLMLLALYPLHIWVSPVSIGVLGALAVAAVVFACGYALYALGRFGAGDVKLMSALALWAGPALMPDFLVVTSLAGGVLAIVLITRLRLIMAFALESAGDYASRDSILTEKLPYGVAIAAGGIWVLVRLAGIGG